MMWMFPFTEAQLRELELQTLIFNYMSTGISVPSHLIAYFNRSLYFLDHYPLCPSMSNGRRAEEDPEPWRCRRTDGKKWRCARKAFQDSKYCERHMHRGKKSSRKLVELPASSASSINTHLFLGSPSSRRSDDRCYNFFFKEEEKPKAQPKPQPKQQHCFLLGTDLMLKNPLRVEREQEGQEEAANSRTQLSISIP